MPDEQSRRHTITAQPIDYFYFNGFEINTSLSDMGMLLMVDGQPQVKLSMSFTTAKSLAENLTEAVKNFEKITGHDLMKMDDVMSSFEQAKSNS
ncbi:MAG: hypothetical protein AB3N13_14605 [Arenibacterium sp.]